VTYDTEAILDELLTSRDRLEPLATPGEPRLALPRDEIDPNEPRPNQVLSRLDEEAEPEFARIQQRIAERTIDLRVDDLDTGAPVEGDAVARAEEIDEQAAITQLQQDLERLRDTLTGRQILPDQATDEADESAEPQTPEERRAARERDLLGMPALPGDESRARLRESQDDEGWPDDVEGSLETLDRRAVQDLVDRRRMGEVLRHGELIATLSGADPTRFNELVTEAEQDLRAGEYFFADRRFQRALRFRPGHPLATAGLAHAQIGAGYYLAASYTLRSLFTHQPEMIDARYDAGLMPNRPRLTRAVDVLQGRLDGEADRATNAFLLAYVGRLLGDRELVEQGLDVMNQVEPNDPLLPLLRAIWIDGVPQSNANDDVEGDVARPAAEPARRSPAPTEPPEK
jgi:hypothetical protein